MPYREVTMLEIKEALRLWLAGLGKKPIARQLGLDPKIVRRYLRAGAACDLAREQGPGALTEERLVAVLAALTLTPQRPRGDTWALCQEHRAFLAALLEKRVRLTKVRKPLQPPRTRPHEPASPHATRQPAQQPLSSARDHSSPADCPRARAGRPLRASFDGAGRRNRDIPGRR